MTETTPTALLDREDLVGSLFFPRPDERSAPWSARDHEVPVPDATLHLRVHGERGPMVLLFHGNGEIVSDWDTAAPSFVKRGVRFAVVDYRGYGRSTGRPTMRSLLDDAHLALAFARLLADDGVTVMGRSLGSAAAWEIAASPDVEALVIDSGFTDVDAFARRRGVDPRALTDTERARLDPLPKIARASAPLLLLHGERDAVIAHAEAERALAASASSEKCLATILGRGHNDLSLEPAYWQALGPFVDRLARRG